MKRVDVAFCAVLAWTAAVAAPGVEEIAWFHNYAEALREARRTQKPIFLEFRCEP